MLSAHFTTKRTSQLHAGSSTFSKSTTSPSPSIATKTSTTSHACPTMPPKHPFIPNYQGQFDWRAVPIRHPVNSFSQLPTGEGTPLPPIQHSFETISPSNERGRASRQQAVKDVCQRCWESYHDHAWMNDELEPVSGGSKDSWGGYGATLVDSLDTLWIMGLKDDFEEAVAAAVSIDFGPRGSEEINISETIIRYLSGFLSAYDVSGCQEARLLQKAVEVGDLAYASFDTSNIMLVARWNPQKAVNGEDQSQHRLVKEQRWHPQASNSLDYRSSPGTCATSMPL